VQVRYERGPVQEWVSVPEQAPLVREAIKDYCDS